MRDYIKYFTLIILLTVTVTTTAQNKAHADGKNDVTLPAWLANGHWEWSLGIQNLAFYSGREDGMNVSSSPFDSRRACFGAAMTAGKWLSPYFGTRLKAAGYWGKTVSNIVPDEENIRFWSLGVQGMASAMNIFQGYDPFRQWDVRPYIGIGLARNVTHRETSPSLSFGINGTYNLNSQMKVFADIAMSWAGRDHGDYDGKSVMGHYRWLTTELGVAFNIGRSRWSPKEYSSEPLLPLFRVPERKKAAQLAAADIPGGLSAARSMLMLQNGNTANIAVPAMTKVNRGMLHMGDIIADSSWMMAIPHKRVSVDDFLMDATEVTNRQYHAFVNDVVDSIIAQRLRDPQYNNDYDKVIASLYVTNPVTGERLLDGKQLVYAYEVYDYAAANMRRNRLDPKERSLDTDHPVDSTDIVWISKDTAYVDVNGHIVSETIRRPLSGPYDFLNTYIVNIYPDTTCWVNDFENADNVIYTRYYFSHPEYQDYPVVGVTWEQANAYCMWRTELARRQNPDNEYIQLFRLPTEAEWEYAARGGSKMPLSWMADNDTAYTAKYYANFMPDDGDYAADGNIITSKVMTYNANDYGLYDMAGNVAEWTSTAYTVSGVADMNNINPQNARRAATDEPYRMKRKVVKGGSWKDAESRIQTAWRTSEYQNQPRSYIGFRCVQSLAAKPTGKTAVVLSSRKKISR